MDETRGGTDVDTMKNKDLKPYRLALLKKQGYVCPLCELELLPEEAALDHCHTTGHVRQVLHRSCNSAEGKILHWAGQRSKGDDPVEFVSNLLGYWQQYYTDRPLHPTHGKPRKRRAKRRKT